MGLLYAVTVCEDCKSMFTGKNDIACLECGSKNLIIIIPEDILNKFGNKKPDKTEEEIKEVNRIKEELKEMAETEIRKLVSLRQGMVDHEIDFSDEMKTIDQRVADLECYLKMERRIKCQKLQKIQNTRQT